METPILVYDGYVTIEDVRARNIEALNNMSDEELAMQIESISAEIEEYCNTKFRPTADTYKLDLCESFYLRHKPILEITSLKLNKIPLIEDEEFFVYPDVAKVVVTVYKDDVKTFRKALEVEYKYGYEKAPATVKQVIIDLIKLDETSKDYKSVGIQSENWAGDYSYTVNTSKDFTPTNLRKDILSRLGDFVEERYTEPKTNRIVKVRIL